MINKLKTTDENEEKKKENNDDIFGKNEENWLEKMRKNWKCLFLKLGSGKIFYFSAFFFCNSVNNASQWSHITSFSF